MTLTPWGYSDELRARKLAPGYRLPPESVARNQRWRLMAAMVAQVAERGYERTTVADVVELSGVSRTAFYRHFENKERCFVEAVDATIGFAMEAVETAVAEAGDAPAARIDAAVSSFVEQIVAQPAAARMCFLEVYAAGRDAVREANRSAAAFERILAESFAGSPEHAGLPPETIHAIVGGARKAISTALREDRERELPDLTPALSAWALAYRTPPAPLRRPRVRVAANGSRAFATDDQVDRIFAAVAAAVREKGYWAMTLDDVAERSSMSFTTFYNHFRTKEDAFLAAYDAFAAQTLAAALPPFQRAGDWPHAVRAGIGALLDHLAREPDWAHAGIVEVLAVGRAGMARHDATVASFTTLLEPGFELAPELPRAAADAIGGAIFTLLYDHLLDRGAERLAELQPLCTYLALAPFTGAELAGEVANERRPARRRPA